MSKQHNFINVRQYKRLPLLAFASLIATSLVVTGCSGGSTGSHRPKVVVEAVSDQSVNKSPIVAGRVMGDTETAVMAKVSGRVVNVLCDVGQEVQAGQPLVYIDDRDYRIALAQAEANVRGAQARFADAQKGARPQERQQLDEKIKAAAAALENAKANLERTQSLFDAGATTKNQLETVQLALTQAQTTYDQLLQQQSLITEGATAETLENLRATVAQMNAIADKARLDLENTVITAPVTGRIANKNIHIGEIAATSPSPTVLFTVVSSAPVVEVSVPEEYINHIQVGQTMKVRIDQVASTTFEAKVIAVSPMVNSASKEYPVKLSLPPSDAWKSGMYAEATLPDTHKGLSIPKNALVKRGLDYVVMVTDGTTASSRPVTTGRSDGSLVEILSGLNVGDKLITVGQDQLQDGDAIQVIAERGTVQ
ncbi:efflux RND transporter periplasmic adaptor subunit [Heliophilum fasciatum]|uniref:RND family efflux transporter MFP subunit n=1 Tax=Heliophilum fasciatum TaxID=35700 RepID=A0A4R2RB76_9FIRM|nr:efflux RND transporter periplasmic adaptor subunit [Heliophilum fasciatum]MCW2279426.1 RND family efflux transporter MFP subunit [Heliophilum fasciatum]TCP59983.1 RND family efflux transporter MFP subunit [Heliophilum fasciatum]